MEVILMFLFNLYPDFAQKLMFWKEHKEHRTLVTQKLMFWEEHNVSDIESVSVLRRKPNKPS